MARLALFSTVMAMAGLTGIAQAQSADELARKLSNPIASLISVPFQDHYNDGFGDGEAQQSYVNIQPAIPLSIRESWDLISPTIVPVVSQSDFSPGDEARTGPGNITQSFFFSRRVPAVDGLICGIWPVIQLPAATNHIAPAQRGAGTTAVALKQTNGLTVGLLANHVWSIGDEDVVGKSSTTFVRPFLRYATKTATSVGINTEARYDWIAEVWSVPINLTFGHFIKAGGKPLQVTGVVRYRADSPPGGPEGWGGRLAMTFLFQKC